MDKPRNPDDGVVVLHPENYAALGAALKVNSNDVLAAVLGIDLGTPNETIQVGGHYVPKRDELGLLLDPKLYAKASCSNCYGNGVVVHVKPVPVATVLAMVAQNPANEANFIKTVKNKHAAPAAQNVRYSVKAQARCGCTNARYSAQRQRVQAALKQQQESAALGQSSSEKQSAQEP